MSNFALIILAIVTLEGLFVEAATKKLEKREAPGSDGHMLPKKRPFCNAFTGCGRKRSDALSFLGAGNEDDREGLAQLGRRVLAEARLWELLQKRIAESGYQEMFVNDIPSSSPLLDLLSASSRKRRSIEEYEGSKEDKSDKPQISE